eukprot:CAMPEP_0115213098 /NCGR_PEP_ID=MMETSP0270-20121206/23622_1 /TAXON_ID=71861 /ORGANISM="Scrippsiella trochoidea, Strain CCMP3099" /LENGTH=649 /DNA_ID=CAMNT_0002626843 /DNA_START=90 /DNA_END=2039 /DNA_ORIENTATION=-
MAPLPVTLATTRPRAALQQESINENSDLLPAADVEIHKSAFALPGASLTFRDLGFSVTLPSGQKKTILEPCSGHLESGQLVALMGPSGCGKSTLLDMLAMKKTATYSGEVFVNGHPRDPRLFRRIAAYVPQEDVMPAHWRVREAIAFNAALKKQPGRDCPGMVDLLVEAFGLGAVAQTYIGGAKVRGISGGQRRRVTLARGVANQASLLFCDEPTSGLSATDAELCIKALRLIAKKLNVLVLVVIHQPRVEVASLFDKLVLLTSNPGRMTYFGSFDQAVHYLKVCGLNVPRHVNPTDFFLDHLTPGTPADASRALVDAFYRRQRPAIVQEVEQACREPGEKIEEMLRSGHANALRAQMSLHPLHQVISENPKPAPSGVTAVSARRYSVSFAAQCAALLRRKVTITLRNPMAVALPLGLPAIQGLVVGSMFQGIGQDPLLLSQFGFVFILLTLLALAGLQVVPILIEERIVMKYETSEALYSEGAAALASFCVDVPLAILGSMTQILLMFTFSGLSWSFFPTLFSWALLLFFVFDSLFAFIAALAGTTQEAQAYSVPFVSIFMLFNGFVISRVTAPWFLRWIFWVSPNFYAFQAIIVKMAPSFLDGQVQVQEYGFSGDENVVGIAFMVGFGFVLRCGQLVALKLCHNIQK